ncbi:hypothetical protein [Polymorphospora lycopeni]|uniref:Leucine rich repeat variant n=1 Tax=Polymorphospora lycopeni TaxID=3140240 RepID=A0ABV5CRH8_9ACTN
MRELLAQAVHVTPEQRARLVEDPEPGVLRVLAAGSDCLVTWTWTQQQPTLPAWAYERLLERNPNLELLLAESPWLPQDLRARLWPAGPLPAPADEPPLERQEAEARAGDHNKWARVTAATDARLPGDLVARLAVDPSPEVRLAVSMRPELSEEQRAAIDYHVGRDDRIRPARWATDTRDPQVQRRCVFSAHIGLRRSIACNTHLTPDLVAVLATDDDFAVRLLLCEHNSHVDSETVLNTYLEATTMNRGRLLHHPRFQRTGLARLAGSPDPQARALAVLDPRRRQSSSSGSATTRIRWCGSGRPMTHGCHPVGYSNCSTTRQRAKRPPPTHTCRCRSCTASWTMRCCSPTRLPRANGLCTWDGGHPTSCRRKRNDAPGSARAWSRSTLTRDGGLVSACDVVTPAGAPAMKHPRWLVGG